MVKTCVRDDGIRDIASVVWKGVRSVPELVCPLFTWVDPPRALPNHSRPPPSLHSRHAAPSSQARAKLLTNYSVLCRLL